MKPIKITSLLLLSLFLSACGQKGALHYSSLNSSIYNQTPDQSSKMKQNLKLKKVEKSTHEQLQKDNQENDQ